MNLALVAFKRAVPGFGARLLTADDFRSACARTQVAAHTMPLRVDGLYMFTKKGGAHIYVNSALRGVRALYVSWHEMAHHVLHTPPDVTVAFYRAVRTDSKEDREAEAVASIALLPEPKLRRMLATPREEWEPDLTEEMVETRLKVLGTYGV